MGKHNVHSDMNILFFLGLKSTKNKRSWSELVEEARGDWNIIQDLSYIWLNIGRFRLANQAKVFQHPMGQGDRG